MSDFVTLSCPSCGAKLQVTADIDRFACSYCGQEHVVKRSGGIVTLAPVVAAINQVRTGVDKTAAELAIVRLQKEIEELTRNLDQFAKQNPRPVTKTYEVILIIFGGLASLVSIFPFIDKDARCGIPILAIGLLMLVIGLVPNLQMPQRQKAWDSDTGEKLKMLAIKIANKQEELQQARDLVSGGERNG